MPAILFVCTANRIRSPLAACILRRKLAAQRSTAELWRVESAGIWAEPELPAMGVTEQAAQELGLDLAHHRTQRVDALNLDQFDLILTMERQQRDLLRAAYPAAARRILTLGEAATGFVFDIVDPPGHTAGAVKYTARELVNIVEQGWEAIRARLTP